MPNYFSNYKIVVLDSTFFVCEFPYYVQEGLCASNVYVSATFNSEISQNQIILSQAKNQIYNKNISFINQNVQLKTLNLSSFGAQAQHVNNDTWGVINILAQNKANFIVITADSILIQRIIMNNLRADIFDIAAEKLYAHSNFNEYRKLYELNNDSRSISNSNDIHITENSVLFLNSGGTITLGKEINSGLEGRLFRLQDNPGYIAKVFKKDKLPLNKYINISRLQGINRTMDISWALFPVETIFYDEARKIPAGFIENYIHYTSNLDDDPLYLGDIDLSDTYINKRLSSSVNICLKVARQVRYLNNYGFLVSDYNMGNFAADNPDDIFIQMWDTDSFGRDNFFSGYCSGCKTSREYDISTKAGAIDFCNEALYQFVFSVISLGDTPISEFSGKFKYDNPNYGALYRKRLFPADLWTLFEDVFRGKKLPSTEILILKLQQTLDMFNTNPNLDRTYKELLKDMLSTGEKPVNDYSNISDSMPVAADNKSSSKKSKEQPVKNTVAQSFTPPQPPQQVNPYNNPNGNQNVNPYNGRQPNQQTGQPINQQTNPNINPYNNMYGNIYNQQNNPQYPTQQQGMTQVQNPPPSVPAPAKKSSPAIAIILGILATMSVAAVVVIIILFALYGG